MGLGEGGHDFMLLPFVQVAKSEKRKARKHAKLHADSRIIRRRPDRTFLQLGARAQILVDRNPKKRRLPRYVVLILLFHLFCVCAIGNNAPLL